MVSLEGTPSGSALQSSNTNAAPVPATALVAEGQTAATFPIETKVVTATTNVTIGATYGVTSRNATLTVQAPAGNYPSQLTITPTTLVGGNVASETVTMKTAAASNLTVTLTSSDPTVASVPASVTIARKKTQATFTVTSFTVATQTPVTITASYGGVIQRVRLTVNPQQGAEFLLPDAPTLGAERVARCASLALTPCLMSAAVPREIAATVGIEQSRYNLYTPELTLMAETETTGANAKAIAWEYVFFGAEPMAQIETATSAVHWYFTDHLQAAMLTTDSSAVIDWSIQREPYGMSASLFGARHQPLSFPGQEAESESPDFNMFRWYRTGSGRYTQADPLGVHYGGRVEGISHIFSYTSGRPTRNVDPLGLFEMDESCDSCITRPAGPGARSSNQYSAIYLAIADACRSTLSQITDVRLRRCVGRSCESGTVICRDNCRGNQLGGTTDMFTVMLLRPFGKSIKSTKLCVNRWEDLRTKGIGNVAIHEWAHGCGWRHGGGAGVPGNSGSF